MGDAWFGSPQVDAALIAAAVSVVGIVINAVISLRAQRRASEAAAFRKLMEEFIPELTDSLHQVVACSRVYAKVFIQKGDCKSAENWMSKALKGGEQLKALRPKLVIPLWGITDHLRELARLPGWVAHHRRDHQHIRLLTKRAEGLRAAIVDTTRQCFTEGRAPIKAEVSRVKAASDLYKAAVEADTTRVDKKEIQP